MNRTCLKNYISLCKKKDINLINNISQDVSLGYDTIGIAQKHNVSIDQVNGLTEIMKIKTQDDPLLHVYNMYHTFKNSGGGKAKKSGALPKPSSARPKPPGARPKPPGARPSTQTSSLLEIATQSLGGIAKESIERAKEDIKDIGRQAVGEVIGVDFVSKARIIKKINDYVNRKITEKKIGPNCQKYITNIIGIINKSKPKQNGGNKQINCQCCNCAKDGYIFTDEENQKCGQ